MTEIIKIKAYAKLNLCLHVDGKLENGFHAIRSIINPIALFDEIEIEITNSNQYQFILNTEFSQELIKHQTKDILREVANSDQNFIKLAVDKFIKKLKISNYRININLKKKIPIQAGLGGGSADVAFVLLALSRYFKINLDSDIFELAASIGSDVLAQMQEKITYVYSRGEKFIPLEIGQEYQDFLRKINLLIIKPQLGSSTKLAYQSLKLEQINNLFNNNLSKSFFEKKDFSLWQNDFQKNLLVRYSELREVSDYLYELGAIKVVLAGSGSSLVGLFQEKKDLTSSSLPKNCFSAWSSFRV